MLLTEGGPTYRIRRCRSRTGSAARPCATGRARTARRAASLPLASVLGPALFDDNRLEGELHWRVAHGGDAPQDWPCRPLARR